MKMFKNRLIGLSMLTIISLFLSYIGTSQISSNAAESRPDLILFLRTTGDKSWSTFVLDINTREVTRLTRDWYHAISWSPDAIRILFSQGHPNEWVANTLVVLDANGQNRLLLTDNTQLYPSLGKWTPDGKRIIFWAIDLNLDRELPRWAIYDVSSDGGTARRLTEYMKPSGGLTISPDGSQIAYTHDNKLYMMTSEGGEPYNLAVALQMSDIITWSPNGKQIAAFASNNEGIGISAAVWSPDSQQIVITAEYKNDNPFSEARNMYLLDRNMTQIQRLTRNQRLDDVVQWRPNS